MRDRAVANLLRLSRIRLDLRQSEVGAKADVSRASIGEHERGRIEGATVSALRRHAEALNLSLEIVLRGPTGQLAQDEEHALLTQWVKRRLESNRWETEAEASYSIYGERGRIDLLGWRADRRAVLIDEQKTDIPDVQDLLGTLDAKERLATRIARERGWEADSVGVLLVITRTVATWRPSSASPAYSVDTRCAGRRRTAGSEIQSAPHACSSSFRRRPLARGHGVLAVVGSVGREPACARLIWLALIPQLPPNPALTPASAAQAAPE